MGTLQCGLTIKCRVAHFLPSLLGIGIGCAIAACAVCGKPRLGVGGTAAPWQFEQGIVKYRHLLNGLGSGANALDVAVCRLLCKEIGHDFRQTAEQTRAATKVGQCTVNGIMAFVIIKMCVCIAEEVKHNEFALFYFV